MVIAISYEELIEKGKKFLQDMEAKGEDPYEMLDTWEDFIFKITKHGDINTLHKARSELEKWLVERRREERAKSSGS